MTKLSQKIKEDLKAAGLSVSADLGWKNQTQAELLSQLNIQDAPQLNKILLARHVFSSFLRDYAALLSKKTMAAAVILLVLIVGPGLATVSAARASLPGDMLYPVKRKLENVQISLTFAPKNKAKAEMILVANRLHELYRITIEQSPGDEREGKIDIVLDELKKNTSGVQISLAAVQAESGAQDEDVVELAKNLEEQALDYKNTLIAIADSMDENSAEEASADIEQALIVVQDVAIGALDILVKNHEDKGDEATDEDAEELNSRIQNQLDSTKEIIESLADRVSGDDSDDAQAEGDEEGGEEEPAEEGTAEDADDAESAEGSASEEESTEEGITADAEEGSESDKEQLLISEELLDDIEYAEDLLDLADFAEALDVLEETKNLVDELAAQILDDTEDPAQADPVENPADTEDSASDEPAGEEGSTPESTEESTETSENTADSANEA